MTITDFIKKKAEDAAIMFVPMYEYDTVEKFKKRVNIYTSGFTEGVELMIKFDMWKHLNFDPIEEDNHQGLYTPKIGKQQFFTTDQLLSEYIKTLNP